MYNKLNLLQSFINHCKSIFLIPIHTNNIHFSFVKELKYIRNLNRPWIVRNIVDSYTIVYDYWKEESEFRNDDMYYNNQLNDKPLFYYRYLKTAPPRIEKIILLDDQSLIFFYKNQKILIYCNFNKKKNF